MRCLIDTNVISEAIKPKANKRVLTFLAELPVESQFVSVLTLGEIRRGVEWMPDGRRKTAVIQWLESDVRSRFAERVLPITAEIAERWGRLQGASQRTLPVIDSLLAATALIHDLRIITRNVADFAGLDVAVFNPWEG